MYQLLGDSEPQFRDKTLSNFFDDNRLKSIPAQHKKRIIILEKILQDFEYDRCYTEKEVNAIIGQYFDDFCTLRRELIDFRMMDRDRQAYWRI